MKILYSYQKRACSLVLRALNTVGKALMVMAPGLGKTVVSAFLLKSIYKENKKVLFLCHDNYILAQGHQEFKETLDPKNKLKFYKFFGAIKKIKEAKEADIVFGSFQSLNSKSKWYRKFNRNHFDIIIVDEGHHSHAPTFREVIKYFKPEKTLCMTGTPDRADELDIRTMFGDEVVNITIEEGIAKGWLTNVEYHVLSDGLNKEALKDLFQDVVDEKQRITINQINKRLFIKKRDTEQIKIIQKHTQNWKKKCIIFCENIHHLRSFARNLEKGTYRTFHSQNTAITNDRNLEAFKNDKKINVILSVNKFNEGIDVPEVEVIVFIRATESASLYRQQLGRGLRKKLGKTKVVVLDFVGNAQRILMIQGMIKQVERFAGPVKSDRSLLSVTGSHYLFDFSDELEDIIEILRVARMAFYETWQEASERVLFLRIRTMREYARRYKEDRQLPAHPEVTYKNYPGDSIFFGGHKSTYSKNRNSKQDIYPTWQKASIVAIKLKIKTQKEYWKRYKEDKKLPSDPKEKYLDFPGFPTFLRKNNSFYSTLKEASIAAIKLGIRSKEEYLRRNSEDLKLHPDPANYYYSNFPGWKKFLSKV